MGDFNYPGICWLTLNAVDVQGQNFVKLIMDCFLEQHFHSPTRDKKY